MCKHKNIQLYNITNKPFWYCHDCNRTIPKYIVEFSKKFKKFMLKK